MSWTGRYPELGATEKTEVISRLVCALLLAKILPMVSWAWALARARQERRMDRIMIGTGER